MDDDKIIAMTRALAKAIQMDDRYKAIEAAREQNSKDQVLQDLIGRFNLARFNLNAELSKKESDNAKVELYNKEVQEVYEEITKNPGMIAYYEAKTGMDKLITFIQQIIVGATEGRDPDTIEESECTHDCSTCGGCG